MLATVFYKFNLIMITKICGIKNEDTLICCEENSVDFFGMIFYQKSPRNISIENASFLQKISENLNIKSLSTMEEEKFRSVLTKYNGIGPWTSDIVLIFF